jgi:hypothetical protein
MIVVENVTPEELAAAIQHIKEQRNLNTRATQVTKYGEIIKRCIAEIELLGGYVTLARTARYIRSGESINSNGIRIQTPYR